MTERDNLPAKSTAHALVRTAQPDNLVARGLDAIKRGSSQTHTAIIESDPEKLFEQAVAASKRGDVNYAQRLANLAAELGHVRAQELLGSLYSLSGDGTRDYALAYMWYSVAADGISTTEYSWMRDEVIKSRDWVAGMMRPKETSRAEQLLKGWKAKRTPASPHTDNIENGTKPRFEPTQNTKTSAQKPEDQASGEISDVRTAAESGDPVAQFQIGEECEDAGDIAQAIMWWTKSAEQGCSNAQYALGCACGSGDGVPVNLIHSYMWFYLSEFSGVPGEPTIFWNPSVDEQREELESILSREELAEAKELASEYAKKFMKSEEISAAINDLEKSDRERREDDAS